MTDLVDALFRIEARLNVALKPITFIESGCDDEPVPRVVTAHHKTP
jgi:hypothetical protein